MDTSSPNSNLPKNIQQYFINRAAELKLCIERWDADTSNFRHGSRVVFSKTLGCHIKYGIERVSNADKLREIVKTHNLSNIFIPKKYLVHVPGRSTDVTSANYLVLSENVERKSDKDYQPINLQQTIDLLKLLLAGKYYDFATCNYIITRSNHLAIIDTDECAMPGPEELAKLENDWLEVGNRFDEEYFGMFALNKAHHNNPLSVVQRLLSSKRCPFDEDAYEYVREQINSLKEERLKYLESLPPQERKDILARGQITHDLFKKLWG